MDNVMDPFKGFNKRDPIHIAISPVLGAWWLIIQGFRGIGCALSNFEKTEKKIDKHDKID